MNPHSQPTFFARWRHWLPSRGNMVFTLLVAVGLLFYTNTASATLARTRPTVASTNTLPYQGRLTDASGAPVNGVVAMTFKLYDDSVAGNELWAEDWPAVQVNGGLFNVLLGSTFAITPSVFSENDSLWLGVTVGGDSEMAPRVQLGSVPFAMTVPDGSITTAKLNVDNGLSVTGDLTVNGNVTLAPGLKELLFSDPGNYDFSIVHNSGSSLDFRSPEYGGGTTAMSIANNGNVGIGTTSPDSILHVKTTGSYIGEFENSSTDANAWIKITNDARSYLVGVRGDALDNFSIYDNVAGVDRISITTSGHVGIGTGPTYPTQPLQMGSGAYVSTGGVWTNASDRNLKENFASLDAMLLLDKVAQLPSSMWNYKSEGSEIQHIGPMAQDFYAAFGVGEDDKHISTVDASGVALVAIQGLYQLVQDQTAQLATQHETITQLETDNAALQEQLTNLDARLTALEQRAGGAPAQPGNWGMIGLGVFVGGLMTLTGLVVYRRRVSGK